MPLASPISNATQSCPVRALETEAYVLGWLTCGEGSGEGAPVRKNFHCPVFPNPVRPAANLAISAASFYETEPLPLVSDVYRWFWLTNGTAPVTP